MENEISIADLVKMDFDDAFNEANSYGFFDWFCKDSSLKNKAKVLFAKLKSLVRSGKFDPAKTYVFFKNNCPCCGKLYDDFRICDLETGDVIYTVSVRTDGYLTGNYRVWICKVKPNQDYNIDADMVERFCNKVFEG